MTHVRSDLLAAATHAVTRDRNNVHGPPDQDFTRIAGMMTAMGFRMQGGPVRSWHVAMIMVTMKLSRLTWNPRHHDNWIDIAGYAACGAEAAVLFDQRDQDQPDADAQVQPPA